MSSSGVLLGTRPSGASRWLLAARLRWLVTGGAVVVGGAILAWSATVGDDRDGYVLAHAVATAPFVSVAWAAAWRARRDGPPEHRAFWTAVLAGCTTGTLATAAALGAVAWDSPLLLAVDAAMVAAGGPPWVLATLHMVRLLRGRLSMSVDLVDAATALAVLGAPVVLVVAEPLGRAGNPAFAMPLAVFAIAEPAMIYLAVLNLARVPPGERAMAGIGVGLAVAFTVGLTLQLVRLVGDVELPLPLPVGAHVVTMILVMSLPVWALRRSPAGNGTGTAAHRNRQPARSNPMPYVSAAVLPVVAVYGFATRDQRPWGVPFLVAVLLVVVALGAVRHTAMSRESRRLQGDLARMAEERRRLLADLLRALEDDRRRTATELHAQAVRSLTTLMTTVQGAHAVLPADTALVVKEALTQAQDDLAMRAEELRQLMLAMQPHGLGLEARPGPGALPGNALASALAAYASELYGEHAAATLHVEVDPGLHLDWATTTITYRVAQEALANAVRHAAASTVTVRMSSQGRCVLVEVDDDGVGFHPGPAASGSGLATMELFTRLGRGELTIRSAPGQGTRVRCLLGARDGGPSDPPDPSDPRPRRHLRAVPSPADQDR